MNFRLPFYGSGNGPEHRVCAFYPQAIEPGPTQKRREPHIFRTDASAQSRCTGSLSAAAYFFVAAMEMFVGFTPPFFARFSGSEAAPQDLPNGAAPKQLPSVPMGARLARIGTGRIAATPP